MLGLPNLASAMLCGLLALVAACWPGLGRGRVTWAFTLSLGLLLTAGLLAVQPLDRALTSLEHPSLLASRDTPYGRITVDSREGQVAVFLNGALITESQGVEGETFVHLAALQVETPRHVLVLGGVAEGLVGPLLQHDPERVDLVELDRDLIEIVKEVLPTEQREALDDPRVRLHAADPRRFLEESGHYDLVLLAMPEPSSAATSRTYTQEFLHACADRMAPGGVLALRLPGAENLWTPTLTLRNASIHRALQASLSDVLVLPGTTNTWLASRGGLDRTAAPLVHRMETRELATRLVSAPWLAYKLDNDRTAEIADLLASATVPANRDDQPVCYPLTLLLWLGRFQPGLALRDLPGAFERAQRGATVVLGATGLVLLLLAAVIRRWSTTRRLGLAGLAGLLGTTLECLLLLRYQVAQGVLFAQLGLLLAAFMAGLALGALGVDEATKRLSIHSSVRTALRRWVGIGVLATCAAILGTQLLHVAPSLPLTAALLCTAGASTSALFALATRLDRPVQSQITGPMWAADLMGGCVGTLIATVALIPLLGLTATAASALVLSLAGLFLLV